MFKAGFGIRGFSTMTPLMNSAVMLTPKLAARQFPASNSTRSRLRALKRKEKKLKKQIIKDVNTLKQHQETNLSLSVDPVLGNEKCVFIQGMRQYLKDTTNLAQGFTREEVEKLLYGAEKASLEKIGTNNALYESTRALEEKKKRAVLTILHSRNTNKADKKTLAIKYAKENFQRFDGDTGSSEVQAAIMTAKIHLGMDHLKQAFKDKSHLARLNQLVQQRQLTLKYLKKDDPERYYHVISRLGLTDDVIMHEFSISYQYLQDYKVFGDKELVKLSEKQRKKKEALVALSKRVAEYNVLAKQNYEKIAQLSDENQ
ncbi:uncharacterized protein KQ657_003999 [Scheffersomyces spartinae]|uniref:Uncharacterized protein n=1 Tax=Scheffersomyces spartinae TaxID=45513 RepID=A0A9P7VB93_9ASCO|nr:uncharacterized protein KQ657_003999 [Scheffersomyces spartinae]KAG7194891.1 hypothetical protein KQ657_003999 [Scheffersomyces spartinae]